MQENDNLNLALALKSSLVIGVLIAIVIYALHEVNAFRNQRVTSRYQKETEDYIQTNQAALATLFTRTFDHADNCTVKDLYCKDSYDCKVKKVDGEQCQAQVVDQIHTNLPQTLQDWSSTYFIRSARDWIQILELGGSLTNSDNIISYSKEQQHKRDLVMQLLHGEVESIPWDDYFSTLSGKEVIVPVRSDNGVIIGAIVRRPVLD